MDPSSESPLATQGFRTYLELGTGRSLSAVADKLDVQLQTVKNWSSQYDWRARVRAHEGQLLQQRNQAEAVVLQAENADWARRSLDFREREWAAAKRLIVLVEHFIENFVSESLEKPPTLFELARALDIASKIGRLSTGLATGRQEHSGPEGTPIQMELSAALKKIYGLPTDPTQVPAALPPSAEKGQP